MRAETEAPFRVFRVIILGFLAISCALSLLFAIPQLIGAVGHAPNASPLNESLQTFGLDVGVRVAAAQFLLLCRNSASGLRGNAIVLARSAPNTLGGTSPIS